MNLTPNVRTAKFIYDITAPEFTIKGDNNKAESAEVVQAAVGYTYALSKSTNLYAVGTYLDTKTHAKDESVKQVMAGLYHTF